MHCPAPDSLPTGDAITPCSPLPADASTIELAPARLPLAATPQEPNFLHRLAATMIQIKRDGHLRPNIKAGKRSLDSLVEQTVISCEQRLQQLSLTADDQIDELLGVVANRMEGIMAALEKGVQLAKSGKSRRPRHEFEHGGHERLIVEPAERRSAFLDERDLA